MGVWRRGGGGVALRQLCRNATSKVRSREGIWWACALLRASGAVLHPPPRLAPRGELQPLNSGPKYSDLQLSVRESGFHDQLSEVTKKRLPFGVGSGELSGSRWWQLGAAVRCFGGEAAIFCSRAAEACGATV